MQRTRRDFRLDGTATGQMQANNSHTQNRHTPVIEGTVLSPASRDHPTFLNLTILFSGAHVFVSYHLFTLTHPRADVPDVPVTAFSYHGFGILFPVVSPSLFHQVFQIRHLSISLFQLFLFVMEYRSPDPVIASLSEALPLAGAPLSAGFAPQYPSVAFSAPFVMNAQAHISYPTM